jgi:hypothetical protein
MTRRARSAITVAAILCFAAAAWFHFVPRYVVTFSEPMTFRMGEGEAIFEGLHGQFATTDSQLIFFMQLAPTNRALVTVRKTYLGKTPIHQYKVVSAELLTK